MKQRRRRAIATVVVLLLISITLALSYSIMRSQSTNIRIQQNSKRRTVTRQSARSVAHMGMKVALEEMYKADWANDDAGVDLVLRSQVNAFQRYEVTYTTGDPTLDSDDADYEEWPYRVTLLSTGHAADPENPSHEWTHRIRAVVQLVPRKLVDEPSDWEKMGKYTIYQYKEADFEVNVPYRIEGPVRVQKELKLAEKDKNLKWEDDPRTRYLADLNLMRLADMPDWRPLNEPSGDSDSKTVYLPYSKQESGLITLLNDSMSIPTHDSAKDEASGWNHPGRVETYQLYPGGEYYSVKIVSWYMHNVTLEPEPETNPLGIYYSTYQVILYDNVTIRGTLITKSGAGGDMQVYGKNVHLEPHPLPPLDGTDSPIWLPTAVLGDDWRIHSGAEGSLTGFFTVWDDFEVRAAWQSEAVEMTVSAGESGWRLGVFLASRLSYKGAEHLASMVAAGAVTVDGDVEGPDHQLSTGQTVTYRPMVIQGHVVAKTVLIRGRNNWIKDKDWWKDRYDDFEDQEGQADGETHFPVWLHEAQGLDPNPPLVVRDTTYRPNDTPSGSATIAEASPSSGDTTCDISSSDPELMPIGARFKVTTAGNDRVYTVTGRTPAASGPTTSISFSPAWGSPTPSANDGILLLPGESLAEVKPTYYWNNYNEPIFVPHPDDEGLKWKLLKWTDNPPDSDEEE